MILSNTFKSIKSIIGDGGDGCNRYMKYIAGTCAIIGIGSYIYKYGYNLMSVTPCESNDKDFLYLYPITTVDIEESIEINKNNTYDNLKKTILDFDSPKGLIKMCYDISDNAFLYWCDKAVLYRELETVARKYCIEYNCKELYVNRLDSYNIKRKERIDEEKAKEEQKKIDEEKKKTQIFVSFKDYNAGVGGGIKTTAGVVIDISLKFSNKGNLKDHDEYFELAQNKKRYVKRKVSYDEYKNTLQV